VVSHASKLALAACASPAAVVVLNAVGDDVLADDGL
jgi:hypothetical protein